MDIELPGLDGFEVARRLRAQPDLAGALLVAMTGYDRRDNPAGWQGAGFDHHLVKPVQPEDLRCLLDEEPVLVG